MSPLAEGRELKLISVLLPCNISVSPLAEGRELKSFISSEPLCILRRPSRRGVN